MAKNYCRSLSRSRYENMILSALEIENSQIRAMNVEIDRYNNEDKAPKRDKKRPLTYTDMLCSQRRIYVKARWRIFRELRIMGFSYPAIARISGFDHTTIMWGVAKIEKLEPLDGNVAALKWTPILAAAHGLVPDASLADLAA